MTTKRTINKAAVIGSGTMGGGIATLLAGVGIPVLLLDIPAKGTQPGDPAKKRNAIVDGNLKKLQKMRPPQLYSRADLGRVQTGNTEDDLHKLADADWIIEVIIEKLDIKQSLMAKLAEVAKPEAIISSNTSGLPINQIAEGLGEDFTRRFMGTHFFNPPRYLHLLEVIPHTNTAPELVQFMVDFASETLGKGVVVAQDEPNFIGNRFMSMIGMQAMNYALDHDYSIEEVDAITGPLIGRPKTATFNLNDLVGFDIAMYVARNLYPAIPDDPARDVLNHPGSAKLSDYMLENNLLGRKTDGGFYQMRRENGKKELWALNLQTLEYEPPSRVAFESVAKHRKVQPLAERIRLMINEDDRAGRYLWHHHAFYLAYASQRVPEITDSIVNIDNAQKWGFSHEMGPFEIWDAIGVTDTIEPFEQAGYPVADWVKQMIADGNTTFYQRDANGKVIGYYSPQDQRYLPLERDPREIRISDLQADGKQVWSNGDGNIYDMGDGVLLWEFNTKANTITNGFREAGYKALELLEENDAYHALVIGNDSERFCAGANLSEAMESGADDPMQVIEHIVKDLQDLTMQLRYSDKPVVVAVAGQALGGGAELVMSANAVVAHIESYIGLVEIGVGVIPAGGGCKELVRRHVNPVAAEGADVLAPIRNIFQTIATATVAESAKNAKEIGFLAPSDKIVMNRSYLLGEAKRHALAMVASHTTPEREQVYAAGRDVYAALMVGLADFRAGGYATPHDATIAQKLATVLTGGALSSPQWIDQQVFLNLERKAFIELTMHPKTLERIMSFLQTGKPVRN